MSQKLSITTKINNLKDDIDKLSEIPTLQLNSNKFKPVNAVISHRIMGDQELKTNLEKIGRVTGWVLTTSKVYTLDEQNIELDSFIILNGEWISACHTNTSYLLEYIGNRQWMLQSCKLDFEDSESAGFNYLAEEIKQFELDSKRKLIYQKLWQCQEGPIASKAFFTGFEDPSNNT